MRDFVCSLLLAASFVALMGCGQETGDTYQESVRAGLDAERVDSIMEGITFGMTREEFHELASRGNREERYTNGTGTSIRMDLPEGYFESGGFIDFFPLFEDDRVSGVFGRIFTNDWAPWNRASHADSLLFRSLDFYEALFPGEPFVRYEDTHRPTFYKIDGNRRVILYPHRLRYVSFEVDDLSTADEKVLSGEDLRNPEDPFYLKMPEPTASTQE